jgi:hypothetical protein
MSETRKFCAALPVTRISALLLTVLISLLWLTTAHTQPDITLAGVWRGSLIAAQFEPLEIVLHIHEQAPERSGTYTATLDIPAQFRSGLPVAAISLNGNNLLASIPALDAEFYGSLVFDAQGVQVLALNGDWSQSGEHIPLRLQRSN